MAPRQKTNWWNYNQRSARGTEPRDSAETEIVAQLGDSPIYTSADESFAIWPAHRTDGEEAEVALKGALARAAGGEQLRCEGRWQQHPEYGWSFMVLRYVSALPQSAEGVKRWLEMRVPGIGPVFAQAIVDTFGAEEAFRCIDADPEILYEVRTPNGTKIRKGQVESVIEIWSEIREIRAIESFLFSHGVTAAVADRLYREYGDGVVVTLQTDPYAITHIHGVGFKTADTIALSMGVERNDPQRIQAGIVYVLEQAEDEGHVYLGLEQLITRIENELEINDKEQIVSEAGDLVSTGRIIVEADEHVQQRVYRRHLHRMECRLARKIRWLLDTPGHELFPDPERPVADEGDNEDALRANGVFIPTDEQWQALLNVNHNRLTILTGGPGVGKSASVQLIIDESKRAGRDVRLCAPTGKAARRMSELTGEPAQTIHRLLEWSPSENGFIRNAHMPVEGDLVVVDEASMLSLDLADALFDAIGEETHVLLVGDVDQLPPIGAGKVLDDLIESDRVPMTRLSRIFRQAATSMIIVNAHRINQGKPLLLKHEQAERELGRQMQKDFFWVNRDKTDEARNLIVDFVAERIPRTFGIHPLQIMVLAPMRAGPLGLEALNNALQERLNPDGEKIGVKGFRVGDRICQTVNDYDPAVEIMNGMTAVIQDFDEERATAELEVDDGRRVTIPLMNMDSFLLAYAMSVHRSQGSQFPAVVCPVSTTQYVMLTRSLLYTAVTRAERLVVGVGESKALSMAINRVESRRRNSTLAPRVRLPEIAGELF